MRKSQEEVTFPLSKGHRRSRSCSKHDVHIKCPHGTSTRSTSFVKQIYHTRRINWWMKWEARSQQTDNDKLTNELCSKSLDLLIQTNNNSCEALYLNTWHWKAVFISVISSDNSPTCFLSAVAVSDPDKASLCSTMFFLNNSLRVVSMDRLARFKMSSTASSADCWLIGATTITRR